MGTTVAAVILLLTLGYVCPYQHYQLKIPNGEKVPHPCKPSYIWSGVGHENHLGGGKRNSFGVDFKNNNYKWTIALCQMDSDRDGKTNGEELGDPNCIWTPGTKPQSIYGLSHPGVCDPLNNTLCDGKHDIADCEHLEFECDAFSEEGVFNFTVRLPVMPVPAVETTFTCMYFRLPTDQATEYHIVGSVPYLDNMDVIHHIAMFGCTEEQDVTFNEPYTCFMATSQGGCSDPISQWVVGMPGLCEHKDAGVLVSPTRGYRTGIMQVHWNNPMKARHYTDSSGLTIYATPKLRPFNSGTLIIGRAMFQIPPGQPVHYEHGGCSNGCLSRLLTDNITVYRAFNHMHLLGKSQTTTLQRNGDTVYLAKDDASRFDSPVIHTHHNGVVVRPEDELLTTCVYRSTSRNTTTFYGGGVKDEMCFSLIAYYPRENLRISSCYKVLGMDYCSILSGYVNGCDLSVLNDPTHSQTATIKTRVLEYCSPGLCRSECLDYVREVKKNPCYSGDVDKFTRQNAMRENPQIVAWYAAFDSCNVELLQERCGSGDTGTATSSGINVALLGTILAFQIRVLLQ